MQLLLPLKNDIFYSISNWVLPHEGHIPSSWVFKWPKWGVVNFLCFYGDSGSGKTHLALVWKELSKA
ncbi:MAG: hypothetical protein ACTSXG_02435, partial [Alphaproteobacteria bacterium]